MTLKLTNKKAIVAEMAEVAANSVAAVAADYRGLTVAEMTELRQAARSAGIYLKVVRNNLLRRAVEDTDFSCIQEKLVGPLMLAFAEAEPGAPARLMRDFAKKFDKLEIKFFSIDGELMEGKDIAILANLPTKEEALAKLLAVMQAPISKFVRTLAAPQEKLVRTIAAIRDQKQAS